MTTRKRKYFTLVASLPGLPFFDRAERLPINMERLKERLTMLSHEDQKMVDQISAFIIWRRQPMDRSDEEMIADYNRAKQNIEDPHLIEMDAQIDQIGLNTCFSLPARSCQLLIDFAMRSMPTAMS